MRRGSGTEDYQESDGLSIVPEPVTVFIGRPARPTDLLYLLGGKEHFTSPKIHNLGIDKSDTVP